MDDYRTSPRFPRVRVRQDGSIIGPSGRTLTPFLDRYGYRKVTIYTGPGQWRQTPVHTLVCETFHGERPDAGSVVRHLDGNNQNNHASNLRWGTKAENEADKVAHGTAMRGERHHSAKLTACQVVNIRHRAATETQVALAREFGVSRATIGAILSRRIWAHTP